MSNSRVAQAAGSHLFFCERVMLESTWERQTMGHLARLVLLECKPPHKCKCSCPKESLTFIRPGRELEKYSSCAHQAIAAEGLVLKAWRPFQAEESAPSMVVYSPAAVHLPTAELSGLPSSSVPSGVSDAIRGGICLLLLNKCLAVVLYYSSLSKEKSLCVGVF